MKTEDLALFLILAGFILIIDGLGSIFMYINQSLLEHSVRILRMGLGFGVLWAGFYLRE